MKAELYFIILIIAALTGVFKIKRLSKPALLLFILILFVLFKELSAFLLSKYFSYNLSFYRYLSPVDFTITILIFLSIPILKPYRFINLTILSIGILFYLVNTFVLPPKANSIDSYFKMTRAFLLILSSLLLLFQITRYAMK